MKEFLKTLVNVIIIHLIIVFGINKITMDPSAFATLLLLANSLGYTIILNKADKK